MNKGPLTIAIGGLLAMAAGLGIRRFVYTPILRPMVDALSLAKTQAGLIAFVDLQQELRLQAHGDMGPGWPAISSTDNAMWTDSRSFDLLIAANRS
jgi:hypothetical protein